jgi:hypothetical protein
MKAFSQGGKGAQSIFNEVAQQSLCPRSQPPARWDPAPAFRARIVILPMSSPIVTRQQVQVSSI